MESKFSPVIDYPFRRLLWLTVSLFLSYLAVSMSLPVISIFVSDHLGRGNAGGGLAVGIAFLATILTRGLAGHHSDTRGGKRAMQQGLVLYAVSSLICFASCLEGLRQGTAFGILLAGRLLLGVGESLTLVGMMTWGLRLAGPQSAGRFLAMMGAGMYGSFILGGPLGIAVYDLGGFSSVMIASAIIPMVGLGMVARVPAAFSPESGTRDTFWTVVGNVWRHGLVVGLQGVGFAAIGAFEALLFKTRGWPHAGAGLAFFAVGFVGMRFVGPSLLEKQGVRRLVAGSLTVEIIGQTLLWLAPNPWVAMAGSLLTGMGCSMIYPSMGADIVKIIPQHLRGTAMGAFSAFQDIAYGVTGPLAGLAADRFGQPVVFLIGMMAALLGIGVLISIRVGHSRAPWTR